MRNSNITSLLKDYARNLTESQWLEILKYLSTKLGEATSANIEIGRYWINDYPDGSSSSLGSRVRAKSPFPGVESDYWEAALCLTSQDNKTYVDAFVFPYSNGIRVSQFGRLDNDSSIEKGDEIHWWFHFEDDKFHSKGWLLAEGPGEWSWVIKQGDEFQTKLESQLLKNEFQSDEPIFVDLVVPELSQLLADSAFLKDQKPRLSLIHVNRNRENNNLVPWNATPPTTNSKHAKSIKSFPPIKSDTLRIDLRQFNIRGGWTVGKYRASIRIQNIDKGWSWSSEISSPITFSIA